MQLGTLLRRLRDQQQLSTREVAARVGVSQSTYLDWEQDRTSPSVHNFLKLADALQQCPSEIIVQLVEK